MKAAALIRLLGVIVAAALLSACASTTANLKGANEGRQARLQGDTSLVVGRIQWIENGAEKPIGNGMFAFSIRPGLLRMEDHSRHFAEVDKGGEFVWSLKPGTYVMFRINYRDPWSGNYFFLPKVAFRIKEPRKVYYIGTLRMDFKSKRDLIGGLSGTASVKVLDEINAVPDSTLQAMDVRRGDLTKALMVHDNNLPGTIDSTPEFQMTIQILNTLF